MESNSISKFKATCLEVLDRVHRTGNPILVTRRGEPVAHIAAPPPPAKKPEWLGAMALRGQICGDILQPLEADWEVLS